MSFENHGESRGPVGLGEGLSRLTATRGAHRGVLTKIIREAEALSGKDIEKEVEESSERRNKTFAAKNQVSRSLENRHRVSGSSVSPDRSTSSQGQSHQAKLPKLTLD